MKKILPYIIAGLSLTAQSQEVSDALRYAQDNLNGTARFRAMSGAFGALGGDLSAISVNPAGSAIFTYHQTGFTLSNYNTHNTSTYFGTESDENDNVLDLNQAGGVFVLNNNNPQSDWKKITLAFNYENTNNFDNTWYAAGINPTNSIANYFLHFANGVPLNVLQDFYYEQLSYANAQAFLGYQGYIINPANENGNNTQYTSNAFGENFYQESAFVSSGYNGKGMFNAAFQYKEKLFFGINLNGHLTNYRQSTYFYESNQGGPDVGLQRMQFNNDLYTYGAGFSFQAGAIVKATTSLRLGLAYQSPTWLWLNDEIAQSLASDHIDGISNEVTTTIVDPNVIMVYDTYKLQTPSKLTGSLAYIFGKYGAIDVDCSIKDYSRTKYGPDHEFTTVNQVMSNEFDQNAYEIRIGGEHRIKRWSLRAGYRWEESPYSNNSTVGELNGYTAGFGYNFGIMKLDMSYSYSKRHTQQPLFPPAFNDAPSISSVNNNISFSMMFDL